MARIVKSNGETKIAISKDDFDPKYIIEGVHAHRTQPSNISATFSFEYEEVLFKCMSDFHRLHGIRINRTQALDHILHQWASSKQKSYS